MLIAGIIAYRNDRGSTVFVCATNRWIISVQSIRKVMWSRIFVHVACFFGIYSLLRVTGKQLIPPEFQGCQTCMFRTFDGFLCFLLSSSPPFISKEYLRKLLYFTCFLTCVIMLTGHVSSF
jgi:hypothetical protein